MDVDFDCPKQEESYARRHNPWPLHIHIAQIAKRREMEAHKGKTVYVFASAAYVKLCQPAIRSNKGERNQSSSLAA
jgi:hypothetical protein